MISQLLIGLSAFIILLLLFVLVTYIAHSMLEEISGTVVCPKCGGKMVYTDIYDGSMLKYNYNFFKCEKCGHTISVIEYESLNRNKNAKGIHH